MDKNEFQTRVLACERRLYRTAYQLLRADADCEDAIQEALIKAWQSRGALREQAYFETWLMRILINECNRLWKKRGARTSLAPDDALPAPEPPDRALRDALAALEWKYRLPVMLKYAEGYTGREIAAILKLPLTTVNWRLRRARALLKEELQ